MADLVPAAAGTMAETRQLLVDDLRRQVEEGARYVGVSAQFVAVDRRWLGIRNGQGM